MDENDFFVLTNELGGPYCGLYDSTDDWNLKSPAIGRPAVADWPIPTFRMSDTVSGIFVPDFIDNSYRYLMISARIAQFFQKVLKESIEYLPFRIRDHRDVELDDTYYVANVMGSVDCADAARTVGEVDPFSPQLLDNIDELHLDPARIPPDRRIFRLGSRPQVILVHASLKEEIEALKPGAAKFLPMGGPVE